ncbi:MAG TPA: hypothetical protein VGG74_21240 [Kofleriaceae bacterium]|jgi:hypothetical protein
MADIAWTDVVNIAATSQQAATLTAILTSAQTEILAYVNAAFECGYFDGEDGVEYARARALLAAHYAVMQSSSTLPAGPVVGEEAFGLQRSYAPPPMLAWIAHPETSFGRMFDEIVHGRPNRAGIVT